MHHPTPDTALPGQESVWDFPRPSIAQPVTHHLKIVFAGRVIAETRRGIRTIETSHPPSYYFPPADVAMDCLQPIARGSFCEWKGSATYFDVVANGQRAPAAAWSYPNPTPSFAAIRDYIAFYPGPMESCFVDGERARPQEGGFYGGWITSKFAGPFKGVPGSAFW